MSELKPTLHAADAQAEWRDATPCLSAVSQEPIHGRRIQGLNKKWMMSLEKTFALRLGQGQVQFYEESLYTMSVDSSNKVDRREVKAKKLKVTQ